MTPEDHQRIAASLQDTGNRMSAQDAQQRYYSDSANQSTVNYLQQSSLIQQQNQQNDLNRFQQQSYQHRIENRLDRIERNTDPYRAF